VDPVAVMTYDGDRFPMIKSFIEHNQSQGMRTIAIIGRTSEECIGIHARLESDGVACSLISEGQSKYNGGISIVPIYLTKGLEFDAVLIMDVDGKRYTASAKDAKLLYVGCTRALHRLTLLYQGECSKLII
jgi:DNA helicase-2/ATP-dependent DNA helicase PcrA